VGDSQPKRVRRTPRQVRSAQTRDRILEAAVEVFGTYGYAHGTTNRIAQWADVSVGSLYQYYASKDDIVADLATRHLEAGTTSAVADGTAGGSLRDLVRAFVLRAVDNHRGEPEFLRVLMERTPHSGRLFAKVAEYEARYVAQMSRLFAEHPEVDVPDPALAARLVVTTVEMTVHRLLSAPDPLDGDAVADELTTMLTRYLTGTRTG
jgi:AcrR family transcriptional regulator